MFGRSRLTLSMEETELRVAVADRRRILRWASAPLRAGILSAGQVVQPAAFGDAVAELVEKVRAPRRKAVVSLSSQGALVRILDMPPVSTRLLDEAVRREARRVLPLSLDDLDLEYRVISDSGAPRMKILTLSVPREALDKCVAGLRIARLRPVAMDLKPLALIRAVNLPDVLIVDLESGAESVILVRGFVPHIVRSVALPSGGAGAPGDRADHLVTEIQRTLDFYRSSVGAGHPAWTPTVCLTGALGGEGETRARVGARWALADVDPPIGFPAELPLLSYLVNVGLALKRV